MHHLKSALRQLARAPGSTAAAMLAFAAEVGAWGARAEYEAALQLAPDFATVRDALAKLR